jgi:hypothetical protein
MEQKNIPNEMLMKHSMIYIIQYVVLQVFSFRFNSSVIKQSLIQIMLLTAAHIVISKRIKFSEANLKQVLIITEPRNQINNNFI